MLDLLFVRCLIDESSRGQAQNRIESDILQIPMVILPVTSSKRRLFITLAILFVSVMLVLLVVVTRPAAKTETKQAVITRIEVARVVVEDLQPQVELTGVLRPRQLASLRFEVGGELLTRAVEPGQRVAAGDLLLALDDADYRDALTEAESQVVETRASMQRDLRLQKLARENSDLAAREYQRLEKLGQDSLASQSTRESARQKLINLESEDARLTFSVESNQARLARQEAALNRARRNLERTRLLAPFDGHINQVMVEVGDYLQVNSLAVELIDTSNLELRLEVSGDVAAALRLGQPLEVQVDDRRIEGELIALQLDPDSQTHTHPIRVRILGEDLMPGQLGRVRLPLRAHPAALVVPATALLREEGGEFLYRVRDEHLQRQAVITGKRQGDRLAIRQGVQAGDLVVARDVDVLSEGLQVQIEAEVKAP
jgi:RND family efflux transporter MFP subunit